MRHKKQGKKFSRPASQRKALLNTLANSFFLNGRIKTTESKAKELQRKAERMISRARNVTLANERFLLRFISKRAFNKLVKEIAPKYKEMKGGYTRVIKLIPRKSDGAKMAIIELV